MGVSRDVLDAENGQSQWLLADPRCSRVSRIYMPAGGTTVIDSKGGQRSDKGSGNQSTGPNVGKGVMCMSSSKFPYNFTSRTKFHVNHNDTVISKLISSCQQV